MQYVFQIIRKSIPRPNLLIASNQQIKLHRQNNLHPQQVISLNNILHMQQHNTQNHEQNSLFINTALQLGYTLKDLQAVPEIQQLERESYSAIKNMKPRQREFYLIRKRNILLGRREKIWKKVQEELLIQQSKRMYQYNERNPHQHYNINRPRSNSNSSNHSNRSYGRKFDPKIKQIIQGHEKRINRNHRYNETLQRAAQIQAEKNQRLKLKQMTKSKVSRGSQSSSSINRKNKTLHHHYNIESNSHNDNNQQQNHQNQQQLPSSSSKKSHKSLTSSHSSNSSSIQSLKRQKSHHQNSSNNRLLHSSSLSRSRLVKEKQLEISQYKKQVLQQKLQSDRLKFEKAQRNILNKSRQTKVRSEISKKIVEENKQHLNFMKSQEIQTKLQSLKFKIQKNQYFRNKNLHQKPHNSLNKTLELYYVNTVHKQIQNAKQNRNKIRFQQKMKQSQYRQNDIKKFHKMNASFSREENRQKQLLSNERRMIKTREENNYRKMTLVYKEQRLQEAKNRRIEEREKRHIRDIEEKIKQEVVRENKRAIETGYKNRVRGKMEHMSQRVKEIEQIEQFKKQLKTAEQKKRSAVREYVTKDRYENGPKSSRNKFRSLRQKEEGTALFRDSYRYGCNQRPSYTSSTNSRPISFNSLDLNQ